MKTKAVGELFAAQAWHACRHKSGHTKAAALNQGQSQCPSSLHPSSLPFGSVKCDWSNAIGQMRLTTLILAVG